MDGLVEQLEDEVLLARTILDRSRPSRPDGGSGSVEARISATSGITLQSSDGLTAGLIPFHKLSQWLTYSVVEILEDAGIPVTGLDELTGLAEYRNGGLFLDTGRPRVA